MTVVSVLRRFNRTYTQRIGVLDPYLGSEFALTQVRVLYELAHRDQPTAAELGRDLALDAGYLSRILRSFETRGWLARVASPADARQSLLKLTDAGHHAFAPLQQKSRDQAAALLGALPAAEPAPALRNRILESLSPVPVQLDELIRAVEAPAGDVLTVILELELAGRIERQAGNKVNLI